MHSTSRNSVFWILFLFSLCVAAQDTLMPDDDLGEVTDRFQEFFFEGLKQAAIENNEKAVKAFSVCLEEDAENAVVLYEMGKSYLSLKEYVLAEQALLKATTIAPNNEWYLDQLYEVYNQTNQEEKLVATLNKLAEYHPDYKVDLIKHYYGKKAFKEALDLLDELDNETARDRDRDYLRQLIYRQGDFSENKIDFYTKRTLQYPDEEEHYLQLIFEYSNSGKEDQAFAIAQNLIKRNPNAEQVHLALYKFYLDKKEYKRSIASLKIVLSSSQIDTASKKKVLIDFLREAKKKTALSNELSKVAALIKEQPNNSQLVTLIAEYYKSTDKTALAIEYMVTSEAPDVNDYVSYKSYLLALAEAKQFDVLIEKTNEALALYPAQPLLYLLKGTALNEKKEPKKAIETLLFGLEYSIENPILESDILYQIAQSYKLLEQEPKYKHYLREAKKVLENAN